MYVGYQRDSEIINISSSSIQGAIVDISARALPSLIHWMILSARTADVFVKSITIVTELPSLSMSEGLKKLGTTRLYRNITVFLSCGWVF